MPANLAGWWTRVGAQIIDALIVTAAGLAIALIVFSGGLDSDSATVVLYVTVISLTIIYATLMLSRSGPHNGQTIGKQAMGIRVVTSDGSPVTTNIAARREALGRALLGLIPLYSIVDVLWPLGDPANQCLHDKVAHTYVVRVDTVAETVSVTMRPPVPATDPAPPVAPPPPPPLPPPPGPEPAPDLGGFAPPVPEPAPPPPDDEPPIGPFGPSYD